MEANHSFKRQNFLHRIYSITFILFFAFTGNAFSQASDKLNKLINERNDLLNQFDAYEDNDKIFKNRKTTADYQALVKKIIDLDAQIVGQANYEMEQKDKSRADLIKRLKEKKGPNVFITEPTDSILNVLSNAQAQTEVLDAKLKAKSENIETLLAQNDSLLVLNKKHQAKFESLNADNESLNQKNLLLILFNSIVIMALIGLLAYMMRKPSKKNAVPLQTSNAVPVTHSIPVPQKQQPVKEAKKEEPVVKISSEGIFHTSSDSMDGKLDQIEKLARLREKGYLTDEEFALQKRQILGN